MELEVWLKCILGLILCICRGQSSDLDCRSGDASKVPERTTEGCYHPLGFEGETSLGKSDCVILSCKKEDPISWKTLDRKVGKIEFTLNALPERCGFVRYDVELEVYDTEEPYDEALACVASDGPWRTHSKRILNNRYCGNCTGSPSRDCLRTYSVAFKYVYPGWYRVKVTPKVEDGSRQSQRSRNLVIDDAFTDYVKKRLVDLGVNVSLQYRDSPNRELDVSFLFGPDLEFLKLDGSEVVTKLVAHVDPSKGDHACYATGIEQACCAFQGGDGNSTTVKCEVVEKTSRPVCHASSGLIDCTFYNVTQGNYCVIVRFEDDRCTKGTVWSDQFHDPCRWDIRKEFNVGDLESDTVIDSSSTGILYTAIALVVLLGIVAAACVLRKRSLSRQRPSTDATLRPTTQHYNFNNGHANRFNFGQLLTLTDRPRPEVLLVYSRESPPFMELVACLRRVLDKICKCQVYDYFDPELWNDVSEDPRGWVHALVVERQAKVVIVASEVAAIRHRSLMSEVPERAYKTPHPFDHLFLYAMKLLRDGKDEDSYKNHFVVTFDGYTENSHLLEYFNPYTRFVLPKHLNKLFEHLHGPDSTAHFDTSRRLEERYEVRQLRLQLEHLINLKLLAQSDVESQKLYDW